MKQLKLKEANLREKEKHTWSNRMSESEKVVYALDESALEELHRKEKQLPPH